MAARRKVVAARLTTLRVRELSTRWPLILLLGHKPSQEKKAFSLRHFALLAPISLSIAKNAITFNPGVGVRPTPRSRLRWARKVNSKPPLGFLLRAVPATEAGPW